MNIKKTTKTILLTLLVCIIILFIKNEFSWILLKNSTYGIPAVIKQGSVKNLYLGSSMFRQGLDIHILDSNDIDNYILAYNGNQPALEYYQLKYLLEHNVQIDNLFVDMYVYSAWENPEINDEKIFLEVDLSEKWNLWTLISQNGDHVSFVTFWRIFVNSNNELLLTWPISSPILNSQFYHGGTLSKTDSASYEALSQYAIPDFKPSMNTIQEYYIRELIQLARSNNINIVFLETPKFETISNSESYLSAMETYATLLQSEQTSYILSENTFQKIRTSENVKYYNFNIEDPEYFMDAVHLSSKGRTIFTQSLQN